MLLAETNEKNGIAAETAVEKPVRSRSSRREAVAPVNAEVPFSAAEIFFSRTNEKGHILFGNTVFQRVCQYSWPELSRAPHSIVRHPDMPRCVFWLLWDTIQKGQPIGAYVKNKAKDGRYYWVFGIVTPIAGGYLSVRIKPLSAFLPVIEEAYAALLAAEKEQRLKPAESAKILLEQLPALGFRDYGAFMAAALSQEIRTRTDNLGRPEDKSFQYFEGLATEATGLLDDAEAIVGGYAAYRYVPFNLRVQAAKFGEAGAPIGVLSMNYDTLATAIKAKMSEFIAAAQTLFNAVNGGLFLAATAKIQLEASQQFKEESQAGGPAPSGEIALLEEQACAYQTRAKAGLREIVADVQLFEQSCLELKRLAAALGTMRIMGKMESARLAAADTGLADLLSDLERYQASMSQGIERMLARSRRIEREACRLF